MFSSLPDVWVDVFMIDKFSEVFFSVVIGDTIPVMCSIKIKRQDYE